MVAAPKNSVSPAGRPTPSTMRLHCPSRACRGDRIFGRNIEAQRCADRSTFALRARRFAAASMCGERHQHQSHDDPARHHQQEACQPKSLMRRSGGAPAVAEFHCASPADILRRGRLSPLGRWPQVVAKKIQSTSRTPLHESMRIVPGRRVAD